MYKYSTRIFLIITFFLSASVLVGAQDVKEPKVTNEEWAKPYQPFRIAGNLYYVGTHDLACYLVTTNEGNILINTGLAASASQIKSNIESLGFKFADTKILLTTQAHYDHVGAMAAIKKMTNAKMMVDAGDADVLSDGGSSDFAFGGNGKLFEPVKADRLLYGGDSIQLGDMKLIILHHPGHTKGSCSFLFTVKDEKRSYRVFIANMPTIVVEKKFEEVKVYPGIVRDYTNTFNAMKNISFDLWLSSHASQFNMHNKHKTGDSYNPAAFNDKPGYDSALNDLLKVFKDKTKQEAQ